MKLWNTWLSLVNQLETSCSRKQTFFWLVTSLIGFTITFEFLGVTSLARGVGLLPGYYTCLLHFFHSTAINVNTLQQAWVTLVLTQFTTLVRINNRCLVIGDGIKIGKEGKKMPGVKGLHQDSESNSKAEFIMGHSIQVAAILAKGLSTYFAIPLVGNIHEGIRWTYRDGGTLLDKMFKMLVALRIPNAFYLVADKYYCSGRFMKQLIGADIHMITLMKRNAVVYSPAPVSQKTPRGRPKKYGEKIKLFDLFKTDLNFISAPMPGNEQLIIEYCVMKFLWRPLGQIANFVFLKHPVKGLSIVMSTDVTLAPLNMILIYSLRFKIEVSFKQAVHQLGAFMYRFWLKAMQPTPRGRGEQVLQFAPKDFKEKVAKKLEAYHLFMQLGFIAQGLMQYLSIHCYESVWGSFGTWLRTIRKDTLPSEKVVAMALSRTYVEFLMDGASCIIFKKFLRRRIDIGPLQPTILQQEEAA